MSKTLSFIQRLRNTVKVKGKNNTIRITDNTRLKLVSCTIEIKGDNNTLIIEKDVIIRNTYIEIVGNNCTLSIHKNCMIGDNCYLSCKEDNINLTINENSGLSRNVKIMTSDGHPIYQNKKRINPAKSVIINSNVWIADNVTILKGVEIGSGCVVGIGSVVTKSAEEKSILAGNPASVIKKNIEWKV